MANNIIAPPVKQLFSDTESPRELSERRDEFVKAVTESTVAGITGETVFGTQSDVSFFGTNQSAPLVTRNPSKRVEVRKALNDLEMAKGMDAGTMQQLTNALTGGNSEILSKEWSLSNPISTGLVPFDLEAPAKLLTPRPTPLRNSIPRVKGQGGSRRFKVISGFTGTGTGGQTTLQPGINETTVNAGPGGLNYIRPPYISYAGYDVNLSYVSWGLSDSVSWQAEYQGQGFEDIRSLSNTALLYATMLLDERLMIYGRGTTGNGYAGALSAPTISSISATNASVSPNGSSSLTTATYWVIAAADAGDLLGTNGTSMHQSATSAASSVAVTAGQSIQVNIGDAAGALGYNLFVGSVAAGPFYYAGRTGYNVGYVTSAPSTGPFTFASAADASAVATNFDGLLTNVAASGGYTRRLNAPFSTSNPGAEFQTLFASLYDNVKADPDEIWMNGFDRVQLSNALLSGNNVNAYRVYAPDATSGGNSGARIGQVVQSILNEVTGKELGITVHPWFPQGNSLVRSTTLPIPDSNVAETSVMVLPQDYVAVQWPVQQFTYDASTFEIGTMCHYAPAWNGLLQGIQGVGTPQFNPSFGDS